MSYNTLQNLQVVHAQSKIERLEALLSYFDHLPVFESRGKYNNKDPRNNVQFVRGFPEGRNTWVKEWQFGHNIITTHGRNYYASRGVGVNPSSPNGATHIQLANPATQNDVTLANGLDDVWGDFDNPDGAAIAGSLDVFTTNYPMVSDPDSDNTGDGANVVTYQVFYGQADFTADPTFVKNGAIFGTESPTTNTPLICHFETPTSTGVQKSSTDTLKVIVNHPVSSS